MVAMVVEAESHPRALLAQTEGGEVMWWVTGCVGGSGSSIHACEVGIDIIDQSNDNIFVDVAWCDLALDMAVVGLSGVGSSLGIVVYLNSLGTPSP